MKQWKRALFSVISLIWGFVSLDYLYFAFRLLIGADRNGQHYKIQQEGLGQLFGALLFVVWFLLLAAYIWLLRKSSVQIDLIEEDKKTGEPRVKRKWFDVILQMAVLVTGGILRWCYLIFWYFPHTI